MYILDVDAWTKFRVWWNANMKTPLTKLVVDNREGLNDIKPESFTEDKPVGHRVLEDMFFIFQWFGQNPDEIQSMLANATEAQGEACKKNFVKETDEFKQIYFYEYIVEHEKALGDLCAGKPKWLREQATMCDQRLEKDSEFTCVGSLMTMFNIATGRLDTFRKWIQLHDPDRDHDESDHEDEINVETASEMDDNEFATVMSKDKATATTSAIKEAAATSGKKSRAEKAGDKTRLVTIESQNLEKSEAIHFTKEIWKEGDRPLYSLMLKPDVWVKRYYTPAGEWVRQPSAMEKLTLTPKMVCIEPKTYIRCCDLTSRALDMAFERGLISSFRYEQGKKVVSYDDKDVKESYVDPESDVPANFKHLPAVPLNMIGAKYEAQLEFELGRFENFAQKVGLMNKFVTIRDTVAFVARTDMPLKYTALIKFLSLLNRMCKKGLDGDKIDATIGNQINRHYKSFLRACCLTCGKTDLEIYKKLSENVRKFYFDEHADRVWELFAERYQIPKSQSNFTKAVKFASKVISKPPPAKFNPMSKPSKGKDEVRLAPKRSFFKSLIHTTKETCWRMRETVKWSLSTAFIGGAMYFTAGAIKMPIIAYKLMIKTGVSLATMGVTGLVAERFRAIRDRTKATFVDTKHKISSFFSKKTKSVRSLITAIKSDVSSIAADRPHTTRGAIRTMIGFGLVCINHPIPLCVGALLNMVGIFEFSKYYPSECMSDKGYHWFPAVRAWFSPDPDVL